ncbi:divalent metal cation transporter [Imbroritus primus]|uniref:divalent metal cation transporter n=1 Tax=Imbroritus primus TaxID=3058603 RepID=UPI003D161BC5
MRDAISDLPAAPGVYIFHGEDGGLPLYIGKSVNLRSRVLSHLRTVEEARMLRQTVRISHHRTAGEVGALLLEAAMIKQQFPLLNQRLLQVAELYRKSGLKHILVNKKDYIAVPKTSGYRGIHLVYKYQSDRTSTYNNHQIEVQLRSRLQHSWATAVETVGTLLSQSLKASEGEAKWLEFFQWTSSAFACVEGTPMVANTLNIAADIAAMSEAFQLIIGSEGHGYTLVFGLVCAILPVWLDFERMVRVLKWLTLALFAYVAVVLMLHVDWRQVGFESVHYLRVGGGDYWMMVVAVLGTTISPYLFFWQASQEAESRQKYNDAESLVRSDLFTREHLFRIKVDTTAGMIFSNLIAFCIIVAAAIAFHQRGIVDIETTRQAALALEPIAGQFAFTLFAFGIIGTGMLAVPVLAGSSAYAVAEVFDWRFGLDRCQGLLWRAGLRYDHRDVDRFHRSRSDQGAALECGCQRRDRRADHGGHDAAGNESPHPRQSSLVVAPPCHWLGCDAGHGIRRRGHGNAVVSMTRLRHQTGVRPDASKPAISSSL